MSREIVCPYCHAEYGDSWGLFPNMSTEEIIKCDECQKSFKGIAEYSVDYSCKTLPCMNGKGSHRWSQWLEYGGTDLTRFCRDCDKHEYKPKTEESND